jgi:hypothetical protein
MRYVFMDNFRGFTETLLPLRQITFLVGENSTGKSSFLKLLYMLSRPQFWFSPEYSLQEEAELGGFADIVSAWASDKSFFRVGVLSSHIDKKKMLSCTFTVHTFENRYGTLHLAKYLQFTDGGLTKFIFQRNVTKYKMVTPAKKFNEQDDIARFFLKIVRGDTQDTEGFKLFPKNIPPNPPLPVAVAILRSMEKGKPIAGGEFSAEIPFSLDLTWIAPIRTKPQRFYDGTKKSFSPEGDHTPFVLCRTLRLKSRSSEFATQLKAFGEASGLYETILSHSFDKSPQSPFEILIKFAGAELNINNVGYGISQVLPLLVEFLSSEKSRTFAVQQPEVHLHPRAQAALGALVAQLAQQKKHGFILETHSDYLIDRCRLNLAKSADAPAAQVIFFQRTCDGNTATVLQISPDGKYSPDQPPAFRSFFVKEEMDLLEV